MANIFISHSTIDGKLANFLCESFESRGLSCWIAPRNIMPGDEWATSITNAILSADIFFIVYSKNSIKSAQCAREIAIADRKKKYILPYKVDDSEPEGAFDYYLTGCQWVIVDPSTGEYKIDELCELMKRYIHQSADEEQMQASEAIKALEDIHTEQRKQNVSTVTASSVNNVKTVKTVTNTSKSVKTTNSAKNKKTSLKAKNTQAQKERRNFMIMAIGLLLLICVVVALLIGTIVSRNSDTSANSGGGIIQTISASSAKDFTYEETAEGMIITGYTGDDPDIRIPDEIKGNTVIGIAEKAFFQNDIICSVELSDNIKEIPAYAFYQCTNLSEITIPDGVTSIGNHAFEGCTGLTEIVLPDSITVLGDFAFNSCSELKTVEMHKVEHIGKYAFSACMNINYVTMPDSLLTVGDMSFAYCEGLESITIPDGVESVSVNAFVGCNNLSVNYQGKTYTNDISELFGSDND